MSATAAGSSEPTCWQPWNEKRGRGVAIRLRCARIAFQAPDFYRRHGFAVVGEITGYPARHAYLLMCRHLS